MCARFRKSGGERRASRPVVIDSRTLQSTPESGARAGYDVAKRRKGSKLPITVNTLVHLLVFTSTPAEPGCRRLARDYERLDTTLKGLHLLASATLLLRNLADALK